eukprot:6735581-Alexandrium_andersonii.AAC.1
MAAQARRRCHGPPRRPRSLVSPFPRFAQRCPSGERTLRRPEAAPSSLIKVCASISLQSCTAVSMSSQ